MTDYTPDTATVRNAYTRALRQAFIASAGEHDEEFDRWLRQVQAEVWDQSHQSIANSLSKYVRADGLIDQHIAILRLGRTTNPYRETGTHD